MMKKLVSLFLAGILSVSCMGTVVFAEEFDAVADGNETIVLYENEPEETIRIEDENGNPVRSRRDGYVWRTVSRTLLSTELSTKNGILCAGQLPGGVRMPGGGAIFINDGGGSKVSVSFSCSFGPVSVSVAPGSKASAGYMVSIPANNYFYKAYGDIRYEFKRYKHVMYCAEINSTITVYEVTEKRDRATYRAVRV